ncbi:MAG TPA: GNAT family N-acetyltransferase [Actinomycetota bacterium]|jgi:ribosomal protein S18 acetylase RimI-like enzyme|nr:GNAT family N-acetyltransferase [Actinomycetota bacterium]
MNRTAEPTVTVREAVPSEHAEAGEVTVEAYRRYARTDDPDWHEYLAAIADVEGRADRTTILVALVDGRIVGSATLELWDRVEQHDDAALHPEEAHVRMLGVHPDSRRRGVARALMQACFDRARAEGKTFVTLHTTEGMREARRMYEALGFERLDDRVFPDGFVLLTYRRSIA